MKFLVDMGISQTVINTLRNYGYDAIHQLSGSGFTC